MTYIQLPTDGNGKRLAAQLDGNLYREENISIDFIRAVSLGKVSGYSIFRRFGYNPAITTSTDPEDIWSTGGTLTYPATAAAVSVVSNNSADDGSPAGTGGRTFTISYLNSTYNLVTETLTLNGTGAVTSAQTAIRFIRGFVATAGSAGGNVGTITITIGGATQASITAGVNQTQISHYTVPDGFTAHLLDYAFTQSGGNSNTQVALRQRTTGGVFRPVVYLGLEATGSSHFNAENVQGVSFAARTDLKGVVEVVSANIAVSLTYELLLVPNA